MPLCWGDIKTKIEKIVVHTSAKNGSPINFLLIVGDIFYYFCFSFFEFVFTNNLLRTINFGGTEQENEHPK